MSKAIVSRAMTPDELHHRALHEAGHATVAEILGVKVTRVDIDRRDGGVCFAYPETPTLYLLVGVGGTVAERIAGRRCAWSFGADEAMLKEVATATAIERARAVVFPLLRMHWPAVLAVRDLLIERRRIGARQLRLTVARALTEPAPSSRA